MPCFLRRIGAVKEKMTKFRVGYDKDKETKWLNRMAEQGWAMTGFFLGFYRFAKCEPGEYVFYAEWEVDRDGVIAAVVFRDEEEIYCQCTAGIFLKLESMPFHLDSGKATLSFYLLGCEEDWLEYCRITGADASDIEDFPWQPDEPSTVTGSYRLVYIKQ